METSYGNFQTQKQSPQFQLTSQGLVGLDSNFGGYPATTTGLYSSLLSQNMGTGQFGGFGTMPSTTGSSPTTMMVDEATVNAQKQLLSASLSGLSGDSRTQLKHEDGSKSLINASLSGLSLSDKPMSKQLISASLSGLSLGGGEQKMPTTLISASLSGMSGMSLGEGNKKQLVNCSLSGLSEMSETSMELLRTFMPIPASMDNNALSERLSPGDPRKRKLAGDTPVPMEIEKKQKLNASSGSGATTSANYQTVLRNNVTESSMDDIIEAFKCIRQGMPVPADQPHMNTLRLVVNDTESRVDRFHKKKTSTDILTKPLKTLKKKAMSSTQSSSGQGCTIVVVSKKCNKHSKSCTLQGDHGPNDITVTREPITRSNFGKWINSFMKAENIS